MHPYTSYILSANIPFQLPSDRSRFDSTPASDKGYPNLHTSAAVERNGSISATSITL